MFFLFYRHYQIMFMFGNMPKQEWTEGRIKSFIVSVLRAGSRRWPPKYETLNAAKTEKKTNARTGRMAQHYRCNACKQEFPAKEVQVDHKKPVIDPTVGFVDWNTFIERMFCGKDNLQVLCKSCHDTKTQKEKKKANARKQNS